MKKSILSLALVGMSLLMNAQSSSEPEIVPIKQPLIIPKVEFFGTQFGFPISNFYVHLAADVNLNENLTVKAMLDPSVWDMKKYILNGTTDNLIKLKSAKEYGAGIEWTIFTKHKLVHKRLIIKSEVISKGYEYNTVRETYRPIDTEIPIQIRLRGGFQGYHSNVRPAKLNSNERITLLDREYAAIQTADSTILDEYNPSGVNSVFVYGGISVKTINYLEAIFKSSKEYGAWRSTSNVFFDVMFAPVISVGKVKRDTKEYDVNKSYIKQRFGFRFGQEKVVFTGANGKVGMSVSWEAGMLPGVGKFPVYAKGGIGFSLNFEKSPTVDFNK